MGKRECRELPYVLVYNTEVMPPKEIVPSAEVQKLIDSLRRHMTTKEPTPDNVQTAWLIYQDIMSKIVTSPLDRVVLARLNEFVRIMSDLALRGNSVQSNSGISLAAFDFKLYILGYAKKGDGLFKDLTPDELSKLNAFSDKLLSVVTG